MKRLYAVLATVFAALVLFLLMPDLSKWGGSGRLPKSITARTVVPAPDNPFLIGPPPALAVLPGRAWVFDQLNWRTNRDGTIVDSTIVTVSNTDFSSDTTAAYSLELVPFPSDAGVTTAVYDSLTTLAFCIGGGTAAPSIDSVYVGAQVSMDGFSWVTLTVTGGPAGTFLADAFVTGKPPIASAGAIESGSSNQLCLDFNSAVLAIPKYVFGGNGTAPTDQQFIGWRYIRFICTWSLVDEIDVLSAWVGHWEKQ
jgi:hypothetical protein